MLGFLKSPFPVLLVEIARAHKAQSDMVDEIKLAADTLKWLNELSDEQLPEEIAPRMRDLGASLTGSLEILMRENG